MANVWLAVRGCLGFFLSHRLIWISQEGRKSGSWANLLARPPRGRCPGWFQKLFRVEPNALMSSIAEGLPAGMAATTQGCFLRARYGSPGSSDDFDAVFDNERAVG